MLCAAGLDTGLQCCVDYIMMLKSKTKNTFFNTLFGSLVHQFISANCTCIYIYIDICKNVPVLIRLLVSHCTLAHAVRLLSFNAVVMALTHGRTASRECRANEFRCTDGTCIPQSLECDSRPDCPDNSDEDPNRCSEYWAVTLRE